MRSNCKHLRIFGEILNKGLRKDLHSIITTKDIALRLDNKMSPTGCVEINSFKAISIIEDKENLYKYFDCPYVRCSPNPRKLTRPLTINGYQVKTLKDAISLEGKGVFYEAHSKNIQHVICTRDKVLAHHYVTQFGSQYDIALDEGRRTNNVIYISWNRHAKQSEIDNQALAIINRIGLDLGVVSFSLDADYKVITVESIYNNNNKAINKLYYEAIKEMI